MMKSYILSDAFDGRTLQALKRVSSRRLARKLAVKFALTAADDFCLLELKGTKRILVETYHPSTETSQ